MKNQMTMRYPSSWHGEMWREGAPCGNGTVGASAYGAVGKEIILLNHADMWRDAKIQELPDISDTLPHIRSLVESGRPDLANGILANTLRTRGYNAYTSDLFPLGDIVIERVSEAPHKHYRRTVDFEKAEVTVRWQENDTCFCRSLFVSRADGLVYVRITADKPGAVNVNVTLDVHDRETAGDDTVILNTGTRAENGTVYYAGENAFAEYVPAKGDYGITMKIGNTGGTVTDAGSWVQVRGADSVLLTADVFVGCPRETAFAKGNEKLAGAPSYAEALEKHIPLHRKLFGSAQLTLYEGEAHSNEELLLDAYDDRMSEELAETMYAYGRYLFVCSTGENGEQPTHLLGLWNGTYHCMWAIHMLNVNFEMIHWNALSGNMPSLMRNALIYIESFTDDFRENAKKIFGCRGILVNAVNTPEGGKAACLLDHIMNWTAGAGWLSQHFYDYWRYTGDDDFLKEHALPFMAEAALFYEDFLYRDASGKYAFVPGTSPENVSATTLKKFRAHAQISKNPTMDIAVTRELLTNLLEGAQYAGMYEEKYETWRELLDGLPDYRLNPDGSLKEWADDFYEDFNAHRHQSHMYAVFPGHSVTPEDELFPAFVKAEAKRFDVGLSEMSAWGAVFMAGVYARLRDARKSFTALSEMVRNTCADNLFSMCNDWRRMGDVMCEDFRLAPFQIDANIGFPAVVNEMLVNSCTGDIELLPALPEEWKKGSLKGLLCAGGCTVDIVWEKDRAEAVFTGIKKQTRVTCGSGFRFADGEKEISLTEDAKVVLLR